MQFSTVAILLASVHSATAVFYCKRPGFSHGSKGYGGNCLSSELASCRSKTAAGVWPACANGMPNVQCWVDIYTSEGVQKRGTDCYYWSGAF
ncbi:hypothetical protein EsH8_VIII_000063 [Colletotrichum jinshuiense]